MTKQDKMIKKKTYIKPSIDVINIENNDNVMAASGQGCTCGCYNRDTPPTNLGCYNCPCCHHDNSGNHACSKDDDSFFNFNDDELQ